MGCLILLALGVLVFIALGLSALAAGHPEGSLFIFGLAALCFLGARWFWQDK